MKIKCNIVNMPIYILITVIILFMNSCAINKAGSGDISEVNETQNHDFISLLYKGKRVISANQRVDELDSVFLSNFSQNQVFLNDEFKKFNDTTKYDHYHFDLVTYDYNSNSYRDELLAGLFDFVADKKSRKIVFFQANWSNRDLDNPQENYQCRLLELMSMDIFPHLKGKTKCEDWWSYSIEAEKFTEKFVLEIHEFDEEDPSFYSFCYYVEFF